MVSARIQTSPLRLTFKPGIRSAASAWEPKDLAAADSPLVTVTACFVWLSPAKMGGVTEPMKVFPATALRKVTVMPHTFYDGLGLLAAARTRPRAAARAYGGCLPPGRFRR